MKKFYILLIFATSFSWSQEYRRMIANGNYTVQEIQQEAEAYFEIVGTERGKGYKPYKRWEHQALQNMNENGMLKSPAFYQNELENYNNYLNQNASYNSLPQGNWEPLGPIDWDATSGWNPGVGRITSIAIDPTDDNHIIVGGQTGGVWKTIDGGTNWTVLTDNMATLTVYSLAIDPTDASIYFWGSSNGVIFKSIDAGITWSVLADIGGGDVNKILINPNEVEKMYCSAAGGGIFKSINSGVDWDLIHPSATNGYDVEFKSNNTDTIFATGNQFFISTDGGENFISPNGLTQWSQEFVTGANSWTTSGANQNGTVTPKTGSSMAFLFINNFTDPVTNLVSPALDLTGSSAPELKFSYTTVDWAGDLDELRVFYKTSAAGTWIQIPGAEYTTEATTWQDITLSLPNSSADYYIAFQGLADYGRGLTLDDVSVEDTALGVVFEDGFESSTNNFGGGAKMIAVTPFDPTVVYVLEEAGGVFGGLHKSTDTGQTFTKLDHGDNNYFGYSSTASDDSGQAPRDMDIVVNPATSDEVHIAGVLTWRSTDGGATFNITSQWTPGNAANENIGYCHADVDILEYHGTKLFVGSDGGLFVANNTANVNTSYYTDLTPGLGIRQFYRIGISQTDPVVVSGGSQDNGTSVLNLNGDWKDWLGADGMETFVDKTNNNILYGTSQFGSLYKSTNQGNSYFGLGEPDGKSGNWITPIEQDPMTQDVIYAGYDQVYKSVNGGSSWSAISQNFGTNLNHLKVAPSNNIILYASFGGSLFKTEDGGATNWMQLSGFVGDVNSIAVHPTDASKIAIATTGNEKVYVSTDGGSNWQSYLFDLPDFSARALVWENNGEDGLYLGMNYGIYYIDNTFTSWQPFSNNLPNVIISELEINTVTEEIYAASYGRGLWKSYLFNSNLSVADFEIADLAIFPNPATDKISLVWNRNEKLNIKLYDALGKLMKSTTSENFSEPFSIDVSNLSSGLYFLKINNSNAVMTKKIVIK